MNTLLDLVFILTLLTTLCCESSGREVKQPELDETPVVWIKDGGLRGFKIKTFQGREVLAFQGIPYAQPPVGALRFRVSFLFYCSLKNYL